MAQRVPVGTAGEMKAVSLLHTHVCALPGSFSPATTIEIPDIFELKLARPSEVISALRMARERLLEHFFLDGLVGFGSQRFWMLPPAVRAARHTTAVGDRQG